MVKHCINPACRAEFKVYNSGFLYAHERPSQDTEFFWLCSPCAAKFIPALDEDGNVSIRMRTSGVHFLPPRKGGDLRVISAPAQRLPWRRNAPADEKIPVVPPTFLDPLTSYSVA